MDTKMDELDHVPCVYGAEERREKRRWTSTAHIWRASIFDAHSESSQEIMYNRWG